MVQNEVHVIHRPRPRNNLIFILILWARRYLTRCEWSVVQKDIYAAFAFTIAGDTRVFLIVVAQCAFSL